MVAMAKGGISSFCAPNAQREIHAVSQLWETSIGPCRVLWLGSIPLCCGVVLSTIGGTGCALHCFMVACIMLSQHHRTGHAQFAFGLISLCERELGVVVSRTPGGKLLSPLPLPDGITFVWVCAHSSSDGIWTQPSADSFVSLVSDANVSWDASIFMCGVLDCFGVDDTS